MVLPPFHTLDRDAEPIECVALLPTGFEPSYASWGTWELIVLLYKAAHRRANRGNVFSFAGGRLRPLSKTSVSIPMPRPPVGGLGCV